MFEMTLSNIDISLEKLKDLKEFNNKYRYRFTLMHQRKMKEYFKKQDIKTQTPLKKKEEIVEQPNIIQSKKNK